MAKCGACHEAANRCRCGDKKEAERKDAERAIRLLNQRHPTSRPRKEKRGRS